MSREQTPLEFEREKWREEHELRKREIEIKEHDASRSRLASPLVIALSVAALGAIGNAVAIWFNGAEQRKLEITKAEHGRILEMIKTDIKQAGVNLKFLLDSGLISDANLRADIRAFLDTGRSPALPPPPRLIPPPVDLNEPPPQPLGNKPLTSSDFEPEPLPK